MKVTSTLTTIKENAFNGCTALTSFEFTDKNGLIEIAENAFEGSGLAKDNIPAVIDLHVEIFGLLYKLNLTDFTATLEVQPTELSGVIEIPATVEYAFLINDVSVKKTFTVTTIGESAFAGNTNITGVKVTSSLTTIEANAFNGCTALTTFEFTDENGLTEIAENAFEGSGLAATDIPTVA
ncbi:MAG: leucine-rich repeat domain-containing protein [Clostridia bacterium]|nr:leucine-rich repeat domain-containing protein [Clostridia bacterium]